MNEYDSPQTVRIVSRSRPPSEVVDEAAAEIERLRLTDAERERVSVVADWASEHLGQDDPGVVALRALMERLK
jgi:hypothetical protein